MKKITKEKLNKLILEELKNLLEADAPSREFNINEMSKIMYILYSNIFNMN